MLLTLAAFLLVLGVLILVHELGHFLAAKAAGIAVPRFSIGFGPPTPLRFRRGETEYVVSWFPLGGYVKMASEEEQQAMEALEGGAVETVFPPERLFESKPLAARILVISAGVIMNFLFAWVAYAVLLAAYGAPEARLGKVDPGSPAAAAGLLAGDVVTHVDGEVLGSWGELVVAVAGSGGEPLRLGVRRGGESLAFDVTPEATEVDAGDGQRRETFRIGVEYQPGARSVPLTLGAALAGGARQVAGDTVQLLAVLKQMIVGRISPRQLGGPIFIGQISGRAARAGGAALLAFMALLSVNLAILNLLPVPVLDGGHLIFLLLEGLRGGRPLSAQLRTRLTQAGVLVLLGLMLFVVINDLLRIVSGS